MTNIYAGWQLQVAISGSGMTTWRLLDGVQRVTWKLTEGVEAKEECGTRFTTLLEGSYGFTGTIERFYTGSGTIGMFAIGNTSIPLYTMWVFPATSGSGLPYIKFDGIKFNDIEGQHRPMANPMTETWTFLGTGSVFTGSCT
jgi:hypothetical protein